MEPVVVTPFGPVRGLQRGPISIFKGIRFATAERFERPVAVTSWTGELDATSYRPQCPQNAGVMERSLGASSLPMDEDCLHLNVFTPGIEGDHRPVLVWIHGGAFTTGSGAMPWYDGSSLCQLGDVVVVTINYRLGALGYPGTANLGLRDQILALRWVSDAIGAFGGNAGNVTIFGESAGGAAVVSLLAAPEAQGLFHRGFAMSPSITQLRTATRAEEALGEFLDAAGASSLDDLRDAPLTRILAAQHAIGREAGAGFTGFSPADDGDLVPEPILRAAAANATPLVLGTTRDEMHLFSAFNPAMAELDDEMLSALFARRFGEHGSAAIAAYRDARPGDRSPQLVSAMQTDEVFRVPARRLADARAAARPTSPTWMYWFTWPSPAFGGVLGSCHAVDIPFAFHNLDRNGVVAFTGDSPDRVAVADSFSTALLRFATGGDPGWPRWSTDERATQRFDVQGELLLDPERPLRELWDSRG